MKALFPVTNKNSKNPTSVVEHGLFQPVDGAQCNIISGGLSGCGMDHPEYQSGSGEAYLIPLIRAVIAKNMG